MDFDLEKKKIIRKVLTVHDEWEINALKKLLDPDIHENDEFSDVYVSIIRERMEEFKLNPSGTTLKQFTEELKSEGKL